MMHNNENTALLQGQQTPKTGLYFKDGKRRIDFVLAYVDDHDEHPDKAAYLKSYLEDLKKSCHLDIEDGGTMDKPADIDFKSLCKSDEVDEKDKIHFLKIHASMDVLYNVAEEWKVNKSTEPSKIKIPTWHENIDALKKLKKMDPFVIRNPSTKVTEEFFALPFDRDRIIEFHNGNNPAEFFSPAERSRLVYYLLELAKFGEKSTDIGVDNLIFKEVLVDAYPLHDGPLLQKLDGANPTNDRQKLQKDWATPRRLFKYQPLDSIRDYFGERIALYFSWLGYYTSSLVIPALVGISVFIYGIVSVGDSAVVKESCSSKQDLNGTQLFYMCPLCDQRCSYTLLNTTCTYSKVTHFFDNELTFIFTVFMCLWSTVFMEVWKRYQIKLTYKWHSHHYKKANEPLRAEYIASNEKRKPNPVTGIEEPYMPPAVRFGRILGAMSVVVFFACLVVVFVVGVVIFRAILACVFVASEDVYTRHASKAFVATIAGGLNLAAIQLLQFFYNKIAVRLTDWECPRTQSQYEDSFTIKVFLFQFFNTYSSVFYVAFLKGESITGSPGNYRYIGRSEYRMDGCSYQGCFLELTIQLAIIMVGGQLINNVLEPLIPTFKKRWSRQKEIKKPKDKTRLSNQPQWMRDYRCEMQTKFSLFWEYQELVMQYGFVTMFVSAFPLAPFFALLNNMTEIRVDAYNFIHNNRRPVAHMAEDIGVWYNILVSITSIGVLINAFVLAFTSEFIPGLVYKLSVSSNYTMDGYVDWHFSSFNVRDFSNDAKPKNPTANGLPEQQQCRYPGFREPFFPYARNILYWRVLAARLSFVLCFVVCVGFASWVLRFLISDVPPHLKLKMKREKLAAKKADREHQEKRGKPLIFSIFQRLDAQVFDSAPVVEMKPKERGLKSPNLIQRFLRKRDESRDVEVV